MFDIRQLIGVCNTSLQISDLVTNVSKWNDKIFSYRLCAFISQYECFRFEWITFIITSVFRRWGWFTGKGFIQGDREGRIWSQLLEVEEKNGRLFWGTVLCGEILIKIVHYLDFSNGFKDVFLLLQHCITSYSR